VVVLSLVVDAPSSLVVLSLVVDAPSSLLQEMTERLKHKIRKMNKTFFIFLSI